MNFMKIFVKDKVSPLPILTPVDPIDREVVYMPTKAPYDPRWMLEGRPNPSKCTQLVSHFKINK